LEFTTINLIDCRNIVVVIVIIIMINIFIIAKSGHFLRAALEKKNILKQNQIDILNCILDNQKNPNSLGDIIMFELVKLAVKNGNIEILNRLITHIEVNKN
jgi:hypothetical protein